MGKRKAEDDEWDLFKDEILSLYDQNPLSEVMAIMVTRGFKRTKAQYERRLKGWQGGARKNITEKEWKYITQQLASRKREGKGSAVTVRGFAVPESRLSKQGRIHGYQTALQRYATEEQATTPPGVNVHTPREQSPPFPWINSNTPFSYPTIHLPWQQLTGALNNIVGPSHQSLLPAAGVNVYTPREQSPPFPWINSNTPFSYPTIHLPWQQLTGALNNIVGPSHQSLLPAAAVTMIHDSLLKFTKPGKRIQVTVSGGHTTVGDALPGTSNRIDKAKQAAAVLSGIKQYLPMAPHSVCPDSSQKDYDVSIRGGQLQLLESIIGLVSNNHHSESLSRAIGRLAENDLNLGFLHRLFSMDNLSIKVFAEELLSRFIETDGNPNLLKILLDCGADGNLIFSHGPSLLNKAIIWNRSALIRILLDAGVDVNHQSEYSRSPLACASKNGDNELVELLLDLEADINSLDHKGVAVLSYTALNCKDAVVLRLLNLGAQHGRKVPSLLGMIKNRSRNVAERLLRSLRTSPVRSPDIVASFFIHAAWQGDVDMLKLLVTMEFETFKELRKTPWLLMEAAAFGYVRDPDVGGRETSEGNAILVIDYLRKHGFHIRALDKDGRGSPLVYAALRGRMDLTRYLLGAGVRTDIFANGKWRNRCPASDDIINRDYETEIDDLAGWNDLLLGVAEKEQEIAPIHAAVIHAVSPNSGLAQVGLSITNILLDHGANPNLAGAVYPIQIAALAWDENVSIVRRLLKAGANPNFTTPKKIGFFIYHAGFDEYTDFEVSMPNALHLALLQGTTSIIEALVDAKAKLPGLLDAIELCTCENNQGARKETRQTTRLRHGSFEGRPICPTWTQLSNCDNSAEKRLSKDDVGGYIGEYHNPNRRECPYNYQYWWNPLYGVADDEEVFAKVLEMTSSTQKMHWLTPECISKFIEARHWKSVVSLINDGTFPKNCVEDEAFFRTAIFANEGHWVRRLINEKGSSDPAVQRGFVLATRHDMTNLVAMFLEAGCWPDDKAWFCDKSWFDDEKVYRSPLGQALSVKKSPLVAVFQDHYNSMRHYASDHFLQAYGEAIEYGHLSLVKSLMRSDPVDMVKYSGPVPFYHSDVSSRIWGHLVWVKLRSSIQLAIIFQKYDVVDWLLDEGVDLNIPAEEQNTVTAYHSPLQCAAKSGDTGFVQRLIEHGADVNGEPILVGGATALQFAAMLGNFEMLNILLQAEASINAPPSPWEGRSAIEGAAEWGRTDTVFFLLKSGADIQGRMNVNYRRTVYRAWAHGHRELANGIQQWKKTTYGQDDCDAIGSIVGSMDMDTLGHYGGSFDSFGESCEECQRHLKSR
ncbi:ankyrin [Karstenula rhodostoma CBS 690.94]|uniref:Ankyrin n=1 Tax=Karstenula rhodostoma CBS 690.94 TaxID=1392251 RepID=A0A9P4P872_9PLEO|nr:ankyrin [Karstenula rhodostoma CBS 690.94]